MKRIAPLSFLLLSATLPAWAQGRSEVVVQGQEKIILKKDAGQQTTIEIRNGKVYIDGDEIASANDTRSGQFSKKIIIEGSGRSSSADGGSTGDNNSDAMQELMKLFEGIQGGNSEPAAPKPMLGVSTDPQSDGSMNGAVVSKVAPGTPAEKAGLKVGDVITAVDGQPVIDGPSLVLAVREHKPGDEVSVKYKRGKQEKTVKATLDTAPGSTGNMFGDEEEGSNDGSDAMPNPFGGGLSLGDMMRGMNADAPKMGITGEDAPGNAGVRIAALDPKGAAARAGLQEGDIITSIGTTRTTDMDALQMALSNSRDKDALQVDYSRNGRKATAQIVASKRREF